MFQNRSLVSCTWVFLVWLHTSIITTAVPSKLHLSKQSFFNCSILPSEPNVFEEFCNCSDFRRNQNIYAWCSSNLNWKDFFVPPIVFCKVLGVRKLSIRCKDFIHTAESDLFMRGEWTCTEKSISKLSWGKLIDRTSFVRLRISHLIFDFGQNFIVFQHFLFPKIYSI